VTGATKDNRGVEGTQQHWVQDQQLRSVMAELSLRTRESWPRDVPADAEAPSRPSEESFRQASSLADGLASAAGRIPESIQNQPMSQTDRRGFASEASRLRDSALELKRAAEQQRLEPMQRALDQINSSCIACHSRYRDFAGELDTRRASADW
jgi:cytochrome c556